jgi:hypothetical protein
VNKGLEVFQEPILDKLSTRHKSRIKKGHLPLTECRTERDTTIFTAIRLPETGD